MPRIQFPSVPSVPGVPQLLRRFPAAPPASLVAVAGAASLVRAFLAKDVWGIFLHKEPAPEQETTLEEDGTPRLGAVVVVAKRSPAVEADSFLNFGYTQEWSVTTAPTQRGAFADYNRVANPFEVQLRMSKGGTVTKRKEFLAQIEALNTAQLYDVVTPERTYLRCNFIRAEISRKGEKGAYWLDEVDVFFREIRPVISTYTKTVIANPASANAAQQKNGGTLQGVASKAKIPTSVTR